MRVSLPMLTAIKMVRSLEILLSWGGMGFGGGDEMWGISGRDRASGCQVSIRVGAIMKVRCGPCGN
jgi:hypothetical protein